MAESNLGEGNGTEQSDINDIIQPSDFPNHLSQSKTTNSSSDGPEESTISVAWLDNLPDCSVCLQPCLHPVKLPCDHVFCFLCLKGVAARGHRCALCRSDIPFEYFDHPTVVKIKETTIAADNDDRYKWYYEGRNGWWQYDERASAQLEEAFCKEKRSCELFIAGFFYVVDIANMFQYRRSNPSRKRRIKRDRGSAEKKGIAGLKLLAEQTHKINAKCGPSVLPSADVAGDMQGDCDMQPVSADDTTHEADSLPGSFDSSLNLNSSE